MKKPTSMLYSYGRLDKIFEKWFKRVQRKTTEYKMFTDWHTKYKLCFFKRKYVMLCAIWYYLYNFKNLKNTNAGVYFM